MSDVTLAAPAIVCLGLMLGTALMSRPVNDDYWALDSLNSDGFWGSLKWYYLDFQGNVTSWFFILLHEQAWLRGVGPLAASPSILVGFVILAGAAWGAFAFLGVRLPGGWRSGAALTIAATIAWLSLGTLISPNSLTAVYYMVSTVVHVWPWAMALYALGFLCRGSRGPAALCASVLLGFLAGSLALVEAVCIAGATALLTIYSRLRPATFEWWIPGVRAWTAGLAIGLVVQLASPATWGRGSGSGSDGALATNVHAVERLLAMSDRIAGPEVGQQMLAWMDIEIWARVLVPVAVVGDLLLRPGVIAVFIFGALWAVLRPTMWHLRGRDLNSRALPLAGILLGAAIAYSFAGAFYAYAGRHVAGLALVGTALALALGGRSAGWWARHRSVLVGSGVAAVLVFGLLGLQQLRWGWARAEAWDAAQPFNVQAIREGRTGDLLDVPLKAGLSMSGLRDHDGSTAYQEWLLRWRATE